MAGDQVIINISLEVNNDIRLKYKHPKFQCDTREDIYPLIIHVRAQASLIIRFLMVLILILRFEDTRWAYNDP